MPTSLKHKRILITGVGIKPVDFVFKDIITGQPSHTPVNVDGHEYKANISAATALSCVQNGGIVHLVASDENRLLLVKKWITEAIPEAIVEYSTVDFTNESAQATWSETIPNDLPLYWVHSLGLSAGTVKIKNDNPYIPLSEWSMDFIDAELSSLRSTITMFQALLPRFKPQAETRICIVSSMSAIRSAILGSAHMAAKGALSRFTNAAMLELHKDHIYITDIRPGIVDIGSYDTPLLQDAIATLGKGYGYDYAQTGLYCMPPSAVADAIVNVLTSKGHITSINMVARGQWPHEGS